MTGLDLSSNASPPYLMKRQNHHSFVQKEVEMPTFDYSLWWNIQAWLQPYNRFALTQIGKPELIKHLGKIDPLEDLSVFSAILSLASICQFNLMKGRRIVSLESILGPGDAACVFAQQNF